MKLACMMLSKKKATTEIIDPRMAAMAIDPNRYQASAPITPPVAAEPINLPNTRRRIEPTAAAATMKNGLSGLKKPIQSLISCP